MNVCDGMRKFRVHKHPHMHIKRFTTKRQLYLLRTTIPYQFSYSIFIILYCASKQTIRFEEYLTHESSIFIWFYLYHRFRMERLSFLSSNSFAVEKNSDNNSWNERANTRTHGRTNERTNAYNTKLNKNHSKRWNREFCDL